MRFTSLCATARGTVSITQYLPMTYLTYNWVFAVTDLVAARDGVALLRNTAGRSVSMGCWWQVYWQAGNLEENMSVPLTEAGQRGENVTREPWGKRGILPSLPIIQQQASYFAWWKMTYSSNKHHRAADVEASPMGRKAMVTLEYFLDAQPELEQLCCRQPCNTED